MSADIRTSRPTRPWHLAALAGVMLLAIGLHFFRLEQEGYGNLYYAAAVKSMLQSWHNFFFVSFDPAGFVSVDKPPLGLWVQAISARLLGFDGWSLMLPQALAGVLSVLLLYHLVARVFGPTAGVLAALCLALTPISVAANRNNTMDSQLVFTSLLAAWAVSLAMEKGRLRWLLAGAALVGIGFNIKMLQAFLILPAFYLAYLTAPIAWWKRLAHLALATAVMLTVSLSWAVAVDLTPADQRPYVGSSQNNTVMELITGHNGAARLGQVGQLFGVNWSRAPQPNTPGQQLPGDDQPGQPQGGNLPGQPGQPQTGPGQPQAGNLPGQPGQPQTGPGQPQAGNLPGQPGQPQTGPGQPQAGNLPGQPGQPQGGNIPGQPGQPQGGNQRGQETGEPGLFRLLNPQLAGQASWLLPLAGLGLLAAVMQARLRWPLDRTHQALVLWGAWLAPQLVFFSFAGLFHRYYLEMLSPAIAALAGAGLAAMWHAYRQPGWRGWLLPASLLITAAFEALLLFNFPDWAAWLSPIVAGLGLLAALGLLGLRGRGQAARLALPALAGLGLAAALLAPAIWSITPVLAGGDSGLPYAGPELLQGPGRQGKAEARLPASSALVDYLTAERSGEKYLAATLNANTAAPIILATGEPVMAMGGFSGGDRILTAEALAGLINAGEVRFFLVSPAPQPEGAQAGQGDNLNARVTPSGGQSDLARWVSQSCQAVPASEWQAGQAGFAAGGPGGPLQLFDCRPG